MIKDKRSGQTPVPDNVKELLNEVQLRALLQLEGFGWRLGFIRRPLFQETIPVAFDGSGKRFCVIEENGELNMQASINLRHF